MRRASCATARAKPWCPKIRALRSHRSALTAAHLGILSATRAFRVKLDPAGPSQQTVQYPSDDGILSVFTIRVFELMPVWRV